MLLPPTPPSALSLQPFKLQTEHRASIERKQPLLFMDVNLGPGRTGRIGLHKGDDPAELAASFALTWAPILP